MKKVLFVCSANLQRSLTAEHYFSKKYLDISFTSAGTNHKICAKEGSTPLQEEHLVWADLVLVMEEKPRTIINQHTEERFDVIISVLGIPDEFEYNQTELIELLEEKVAPILS